MMTAKSIVVTKLPRPVIWHILRDRLDDLVCYMEDIESIEVQSRQESNKGVVRVVNLWRARPNLPPLIASHVDSEVFEWTDRAEWRESRFEAHWVIEPHFLKNQAECAGITAFSKALGGKGTRLTFEVDLAGLQMTGGAKTIMAHIIQENYRQLVGAAGRLIQED